jgi:apolipoprotein N-acyltransferase
MPERPRSAWSFELGLPLVAALVCSVPGNGARPLALAAWLAPLFFLRFLLLPRGPLRVRFAVAGALNTAALAAALRGMVPVPPGVFAGMCLILGFATLLPLLLHALLRPRLPAGLSLWVLPVALVGSEQLVVRLQPFGSWGAIAYSQAGVLPLVQLGALVGLSGAPLLIGLFAAAAVEAWCLGRRELLKRHGAPVRRGLAVAIGLVALAALVGQLRLQRVPTPGAGSPQVVVATVGSVLSEPLAELQRPLYELEAPEAVQAVRWPELFAQAERVRADLLIRTRSAAHQGAAIVVWPETAAIVRSSDEARFLAEAGAVARERGIYLAAALGTVLWTGGAVARDERLLDNQVVLLGPDGPDGQVLARYRKTMPVPGAEAALIRRGEQPPPIVATPYGRLALLICFDLDFPHLVRGVAAAGADLVLVPAEDWRAIDPYHSQMAAFRAVENGVSLVRATRYGLSLAVDPWGRVRGAADYFEPSRGELMAALPRTGIPTPYTRLGDWFGWACAGLLALLWLWAARAILLK